MPPFVLDLSLIAAGVVLLYAGGEALVRGAVGLATRLGLSELVIGLTVVSFGTSSPELAATLAATLDGAHEVAFGNVVGSNIANVGLVLGLTAAVFPVHSQATLLRREIPLMLVASVLLLGFVHNGTLGRGEGITMVLLLTAALFVIVRSDDGQITSHTGEIAAAPGLFRPLLLVVVGIGLLVIGADLLVDGARAIALRVGISDRVIGLTMVAFGTSLPELASSLVAALKRQGDIVLGNVIGSNFFNILLILGLTTGIQPIRVDPSGLWPHLTVMIGLSLSLWPLLYHRSVLGRTEGVALVAIYLLYVYYLFS